MYVHALHMVHAFSDLRVAAGRLRDGVSRPSSRQDYPADIFKAVRTTGLAQ